LKIYFRNEQDALEQRTITRIRREEKNRNRNRNNNKNIKNTTYKQNNLTAREQDAIEQTSSRKRRREEDNNNNNYGPRKRSNFVLQEKEHIKKEVNFDKLSNFVLQVKFDKLTLNNNNNKNNNNKNRNNSNFGERTISNFIDDTLNF